MIFVDANRVVVVVVAVVRVDLDETHSRRLFQVSRQSAWFVDVRETVAGLDSSKSPTVAYISKHGEGVGPA